MSMYKDFKTNSKIEQEGVVLDYGSFRVTVARAGRGNRDYTRTLEAKTQPYRRAIATGTMNQERSMEIFYEVFADAVVRNWEVTQEDGSYKQGIEGPDGNLLPFTRANVIATFKALPDLFDDIKEQAERQQLFRADVAETDAKN